MWSNVPVFVLFLCRSSCTVTTWTASTSWFTLRSCRQSSVGWCRRTIWEHGRERCWITPTTRRPTTVRSPTLCRYKTWRETWRKTCPRKPWRGGIITFNTSTSVCCCCCLTQQNPLFPQFLTFFFFLRREHCSLTALVSHSVFFTPKYYNIKSVFLKLYLSEPDRF